MNCWPKPTLSKTGANWGQILAFLGQLPPPAHACCIPACRDNATYIIRGLFGCNELCPAQLALCWGCGMCNTSCTGPRGGQLLPAPQPHNAPMFPEKIPAWPGGSAQITVGGWWCPELGADPPHGHRSSSGAQLKASLPCSAPFPLPSSIRASKGLVMCCYGHQKFFPGDHKPSTK